MVEPKRTLSLRIQFRPILTRHFQQRVGADDIGLYEISRTVDGTINMALRREMHNNVGLVLTKDSLYRVPITDIDFLKLVAVAISNIDE
jgi:hypothetical protein